MSDEEKDETYSAFNDYLRNLIRNSPKQEPEDEESIPVETESVIKEENTDTVSITESEENTDSEISVKDDVIGEEDVSFKENIDADSLIEGVSGDSDNSVDISSVLGEGSSVQEIKIQTEEDSDEEAEEEDIPEETDTVDEYIDDSDESYEEDDNHYMDPLEEQLLYSSDDDSISFDELNNEDTDDEEEEEDRYNQATDKKGFSEVHGSKGKYMAGKSKKTLILSVLVGIFAILLISLEVRKIMEERKTLKEKNTQTSTINTDGYKPDFGDYASRAHKTDIKDENVSNTNYTEALLTTNDRQTYEQDKKDYRENNNKSNNNTYNSNSSSSAPASTSWIDAVESSIRYQGFNTSGSGGSFGDIVGNISGGMNTGYIGGSYDPSLSYMDGYNQILGALNNNSATGNNPRVFNSGSYDKNAASSANYIPENSIYPGTVIHAVMVSGINTDFPGAITARVLNNVYDSKTGKNLLIPSGSILRGSYSSASIGINRVQIAWTELILNRDGKDYMIHLGSMNGIDRKGYSGIKGTLNDHAFAYVKAMGLSCMFTLMNSQIYKYSKASKSTTKRQLIEDSQDIANSLTDKILDRSLDIEPTITVKPGTFISVDVDKVLTLVPYSRDIPTQKYIRK